MATPTSLDPSALTQVREILESLPGVRRAVVEESGIWIICDPRRERKPIELAARGLLASAGLDPVNIRVDVAVAAGTGERRRLRLENVERISQRGGTRIRVTLEWKNKQFIGEIVGEAGLVLEQRSAALAALEAIHQLTGPDMALRLVGVKHIKAFDEDIIVVSVHRPGSNPGNFVGAVRGGSDPLRAAAVAALHALNRTLGNYLVTVD